MVYLFMTYYYGCFSAYDVAIADGLPYGQLFMYIQRYSHWIEQNFEKEHMFCSKSSQLKITWFILWQTLEAIDGYSLA